jgi:hypothetical protein
VFRQTIQSWVNQLWVEKDQRIDALRAEAIESAAGTGAPDSAKVFQQ